MARQLRTRKAKSYHAEALEKDSIAILSENGSSSDDFKTEDDVEMHVIKANDDLSFLGDQSQMEVEERPTPQAAKPKKRKRSFAKRNENPTPELARLTTRKKNVVQQLSSDHRHRPQPLYRRKDLVERLL